MRRFAWIISTPLWVSLVLVAAKYLLNAKISLLWALSPLWLTVGAAWLLFVAVWLNIAIQRMRLSRGSKRCRNCLHCSLAEIRPGRRLCLEKLQEVSPTDKGCEKFLYVIQKDR